MYFSGAFLHMHKDWHSVLWGNNYIFVVVVVVANTAKRLSSAMYLSVHIFSLNLGQSSPKQSGEHGSNLAFQRFFTLSRGEGTVTVLHFWFDLWRQKTAVNRLVDYQQHLGLGGWNRSKLCISHTGGVAPGMATVLQVLFWVFLGLC